MKDHDTFDVIIIGGSYSGLAAGMALGRALKKVLIIDSGKACNRQTPYSHNFITQDGIPPKEIAAIALQQVERYDTVKSLTGLAVSGRTTSYGFEIEVATGERINGKKLIFASGIQDIMPDIPGYAACWGISVIHCPYCHGYEVAHEKTGILANGEIGYEIAGLISNWTADLTLFTNGVSTLTNEQCSRLAKHGIDIEEKEIERFEHNNGVIHDIIFRDGTKSSIKALYARPAFEQHCQIPEVLGCEISDEGYLKVDTSGQTTISGVFACGDNVTRLRAVANAAVLGTMAGMAASKQLISEAF